MADDVVRRPSRDEPAAMRARSDHVPTSPDAPVYEVDEAFWRQVPIGRPGSPALQEGHAARERWLREEVAPVYDAMTADPGRALSADSVFAEIRTRHACRWKAGS